MIKLIWVGRTKERFLQEGVASFARRMERFSSLKVVEVKDSNVEEEGERILKALGDDHAVVLDVKGRELSSEEFSSFIKKNSDKNIAFVLGGAEGLSPDVKERADFLLSLSKMTYTHEMARLILLEQIYRSYTIIKGICYHK
jgi:23S rRNA (pseudouridine1915-N3)-methyltransferase